MKFKDCILLLFLLPAVSILAQYEVTVEEATIWVHVMDKNGNPVTGLKQEDFEIYEDGKLMPITCFDEQNNAVTQKSPDSEEAKVAGDRKFVLFVDLLNTTPQELNNIKPKIQDFLKQISQNKWQVMFTALTTRGKLGIIAPFTTDTNRIRILLDKAPANASRDYQIRNNERTIRDTLNAGLENPQLLENVIRTAYSMAQGFSREEEENGLFSLAALESFGAHLVNEENQSHATILYISGGFHAEPGRQYFDMIDSFAQQTAANQDSVNFALTFPRSVSETKFDVRREVKNSVGRLNKMNVTLYTINTRGMFSASDSVLARSPGINQANPDSIKDYQESLMQIADETGGTYFANSQNFKVGFDQVMDDLNHRYELCFRPPKHEKAGQYHEIHVVCKKTGVEIRHRKGYIN